MGVQTFAFGLTHSHAATTLLATIPMLISRKGKQDANLVISAIAFAACLSCAFLYQQLVGERELKRMTVEQEFRNAPSYQMPIGDTSLIQVSPESGIHLAKAEGTLTALVTGRPTKSISGSPIYNKGDAERLLLEASDPSVKRILLIGTNPRYAEHFARHFEQNGSVKPTHYTMWQYKDVAKSISDKSPPLTKSVSADLSSKGTRYSEFMKQYNIVTIGSGKLFDDDYYGDGLVVFKHQILTIDNKEWNRLGKKFLDPSKPTVIFYPDLQLFGQNETTEAQLSIISSYIADKMGLESVLFIKTRPFIDNHPFDNNHTHWIPNEGNIINPADMYTIHNRGTDYKVLCFSNDCLEVFPEEKSVNILESNAVSFKNNLVINLNNLQDLKDSKLIIAPEDSESLNLAYRFAEALHDNGFNFEGITYHPALYFGASYMDNSSGKISDDGSLLDFSLTLSEIKFTLTPEQPLITSLLALIIFGLSIGLAMYLLEWSVILSLLVTLPVVYITTHFVSFVQVDEAFYITKTISVIAVLALAVAGAYAKNKSYYSAAISGFVILYIWGDILPVLDIFIFCVFVGKDTPAIARYLTETLSKRQGVFHDFNQIERLGEKAKDTLPYVKQRQKGFIVDSSCTNLSKHLKRGREYILRSNHLSHKETFLAGYFDSYRVNKQTANSMYKKALKKLESELAPNDIQFWLQPYISCKQYGVAASHSDENPLLASYSLGEEGDVTEGLSKPSKNINRTLINGTVEKAILKALRAAEQEFECGVVIEFGIDIKGKLHVLQVRRQILAPSHDQTLCEKYIKTINKNGTQFIEVPEAPISPFGRSILSIVFNYNVFSAGEKVYVNKGAHCAEGNLNDVLRDLHNLRVKSHAYKSVRALAYDIGLALKPITGAYFTQTHTDAPDANDIVVSMEIRKVLLEENLCLSNDFDSASPLLKGGDLKATEPYIRRDTYHDIFSYGFSIIGSFIRKECQGYAGISLDAYEKGGKPLKWQAAPSEKSIFNIVVDGEFGEGVSFDSFLSSTNKEKLHIVTSSIPSAAISEALKAKSITLLYGSSLSHMALSAKATNTPIRISK